MRARIIESPGRELRVCVIALSAALLPLATTGCAARRLPGADPRVSGAVARDTSRRSAPLPPGAVAVVQPSVTVVDLSSKFLAFYDSASAGRLDPDARWALWKRLYGFAAVPPTPFGDTLARRLLDSAWARYPAALPRIRQGVAALGFAPDSALRRVVALLGCGRETRVRLTVFVGGFEANAFAFTSRDGTPTVAIPLEAGDALSSAIHEFTHAVHRSSSCADIRSGYAQSLAELVVSEGVAMRAAEQLLPGRPAINYIGGALTWLDSAEARRTAILRGIREHLSESGAATAQRFTFGGGTTGLPREGYYAGWEVVGALLRSGMSLREIATTPADRLAALVLRGIQQLESERTRGGQPHQAYSAVHF